jgi:archaemetzincin
LNLQCPHRIALCTVGDIDSLLVKAIREEIEKVFGLSTGRRSLLDTLAFAYDSKRDQYHSTLILEKLSETVPDTFLKVLAIVQVDLFIPILTYVYGEALLGGKSCIVSTCRLKTGRYFFGDPQVFQDRIVKEAVHELGHTFDLRHCRERTCIMHYCRTLEDVDAKSGHLCRYCSVMLSDALKKYHQ